jgi:hypothetical protein
MMRGESEALASAKEALGTGQYATMTDARVAFDALESGPFPRADKSQARRP